MTAKDEEIASQIIARLEELGAEESTGGAVACRPSVWRPMIYLCVKVNGLEGLVAVQAG